MGNHTDPPVSWRELAAVLATMPGTYQRLLTVHIPDHASGRCRACTVGGTGIPHEPWPCPMRKLARLAEQIHRGRTG